jgi:hypothetical protein
MRVKSTILALAATAAVAAPASMANPATIRAASSSSCHKPRGYVVQAKSHEAVVFRRRSGLRAYGCLYRRGKLVLLSDAVGNYRLAGRYVAYLLHSSDTEGTFTRVMVRDLRSGGFRHIEAAYSQLPESRPDDGEADAKVTDLTLKRDGAVAWISCPPSDPGANHCYASDPEAPYEVWRADSRGRKLLDASDAVGLRSLHREGARITWLRGGEMRSATLR